jgi:lipopolysaccharide/colanic/teichoic acid biosynthesis glycosyltransferase
MSYNERVALDCEYVATMSVRADLQLMCRTPLALARAD